MVNRVPDITRLVDRMEKIGLVKRRHFPSDRRVVLVQITQKGSDLLEELDEPVLQLHRNQLGHLTESERPSSIVCCSKYAIAITKSS